MSSWPVVVSVLYGLVCCRYFCGRWPLWVLNWVEGHLGELRPRSPLDAVREAVQRAAPGPSMARALARKSGLSRGEQRRLAQVPRYLNEARRAAVKATQEAERDYRDAQTRTRAQERADETGETQVIYVEDSAIPVFVVPSCGMEGT